VGLEEELRLAAGEAPQHSIRQAAAAAAAAAVGAAGGAGALGMHSKGSANNDRESGGNELQPLAGIPIASTASLVAR
jgi:hypothetical protein